MRRPWRGSAKPGLASVIQGLKELAVMHRTTIKADDIAETAMQLGHLTGACALVQPVDVCVMIAPR